MTSIRWPLVEVAARLLERDEREAVVGDLLETGEGAWRGLLDVLGLVVRRQLLHWKNWQPWLATFGLALPGSLLLMGVSVSVSLIYERLIDHRTLVGSPQAIHEGFLQLLCRGLLLIACSWACGFVMASMSRRTLWVSIASSCFACLFCLVRFREPSLSRLCLFLFLLPFKVHKLLLFDRRIMNVVIAIAREIAKARLIRTKHKAWRTPQIATGP